VSSAPSIAADPTKTHEADYKSIALLSACHFSDDINQGVVPAMLPFLIAAYHLTYAAAAGLVLAQTLFSSVAQPLFGLLADRRSSPWLIPIGLSFAGLGVALTGLISIARGVLFVQFPGAPEVVRCALCGASGG
jgi:MFS family permease